MKKPIIAVDVDDVLFPTNDVMRQFINDTFGTNHTEDDYKIAEEYKGYWEKVWGISHEEAEERYAAFVKSGVLLKGEPIHGSIEIITELEKTYDFVVLSARHDDQVEVTHKWLLEHFPSTFKDVQFISGWYHGRKITKAEVCKQIGASYLIDDNVEHCMVAQEQGVSALLFGDFGWNSHQKEADKLVRVRDWQAVKEYFDGQSN